MLQEEQYIRRVHNAIVKLSCLHWIGKTKVSYYFLLREKQNYHITSRSSELS